MELRMYDNDFIVYDLTNYSNQIKQQCFLIKKAFH